VSPSLIIATPLRFSEI